MAAIAPARHPPRDATATPRLVALIIGGLAIAGLVLHLAVPGRVPWIQAFFILFGSLLIQALPFVLIGALAAALIEVFVPVGTLERLAQLPRPLQLPAAGLAGVAFPICECGSVPVARRLMAKGLMPSAAITFMLAAPVVNPVVIVSTFVAYRSRGPVWTMVLGRFGLGLLVAIAVGWALGRRTSDELLRPGEPDHAAHLLQLDRPEPRWRLFFVHLGNDFLFMGRYLVFGATVAAFVQTFLPQSPIVRIAGIPILDVLVLMGLAALLSLCSESDAFIAASFTQFGPSAQLAFLVFGPMVDLKLAAIYAGTFRGGVVRTIVIGAGIVTLVSVMWLRVVSG
ncbi:MAG: permease [Actinomycetota bacterium]